MDYFECRELYHYGVKGMKWGERKEYEPVEKQTPKKKLTTAQKVLIGVGGVSVAAAAAYGISKSVKYSVDSVIKAGTTIQRVSTNVKGDLNPEFYASNNKHDNKRYEGLMPLHLEQTENKESYKHKYTVGKDIKVASNKNAKRVYKQLVREGKIHSKGGYDTFNRNLISRDNDSITFYKKLQELGYGAIQDRNDKKYSGYNTKNPIIFFGNSSSHMQKISSTKITDIKDKGIKELSKALLETLGIGGAKVGAAGGTILYAKQFNKHFVQTNKGGYK